MSDYSTTGAKHGRDYGARHPVLRDSIVLHHGCVLAFEQRAPRAPHRKCRRIGGRYFNRERSEPTSPWVRTGSYRPRIRTGYVVFFEKLFSDRPPASDPRGALSQTDMRKGVPRNTPDRAVFALLRPPARQALVIHLLATPAVQCSLFAPV